jgi:nitrate reductase gamma subunit
MTAIPYLAAYLGITVFLIAVIVRLVMWIRMPIHVRWELYPVAHEGKKASYGGSYLEESEWWKKPRHFSVLGELKVMIPEILFLVALKEHNRRMWTRSFPFHFGLYLVIGATVFMILEAVVLLFNPDLISSTLVRILDSGILIFGIGGLVLGFVGAAGLLHRRLTVWELKEFSAPADYFNLVLFVLIFGVSIIGCIIIWPGFFSIITVFIANLLTLDLAPIPGSGVSAAIPAISVVLMSALLAYIPLTHMSHFIGKYFAYHSIRWNDEPNLPGGSQEKVIQEALSRPVSWAAPHIRGDGKKTWADVATHIPDQEAKK